MEYIQNYDEQNPSTHQGFDLDKNTMNEIYSYFGLESGTKDFIGHAMALWSNDDYLNEVARPTYERILLYAQSVAKYGKSPYIYPLYGLGELPQGFARLSAIYGGTYMLDTPIDEVLYEGEGDDKKFAGVVTKEGTAKAPIVVADPTYFPEYVKKTGQKVIRAICLLDHSVRESIWTLCKSSSRRIKLAGKMTFTLLCCLMSTTLFQRVIFLLSSRR